MIGLGSPLEISFAYALLSWRDTDLRSLTVQGPLESFWTCWKRPPAFTWWKSLFQKKLCGCLIFNWRK